MRAGFEIPVQGFERNVLGARLVGPVLQPGRSLPRLWAYASFLSWNVVRYARVSIERQCPYNGQVSVSLTYRGKSATFLRMSG